VRRFSDLRQLTAYPDRFELLDRNSAPLEMTSVISGYCLSSGQSKANALIDRIMDLLHGTRPNLPRPHD
jgi:hypothetical protein